MKEKDDEFFEMVAEKEHEYNEINHLFKETTSKLESELSMKERDLRDLEKKYTDDKEEFKKREQSLSEQLETQMKTASEKINDLQNKNELYFS